MSESAGGVASEAAARDYFALFGLKPQFLLDQEKLQGAWYRLQGEVHPDRIVRQAGNEQSRLLLQATQLNEAFETLRQPLLRARYLLQINGIDIDLENNTSVDADFLMEQMQWREELDEARSSAEALDQLLARIEQALAAHFARLQALFDQQGDYRAGAEVLRELFFLEKLRDQIDLAHNELDQ